MAAWTGAVTAVAVAVILKGRQPSSAMLAQLEGIRTAWIGYWSKVTGVVSTMETKAESRAQGDRPNS